MTTGRIVCLFVLLVHAQHRPKRLSFSLAGPRGQISLESAALEDGLHFAPAPDGESYILEPATAEELAAYQKAKEEAEDEENEEE